MFCDSQQMPMALENSQVRINVSTITDKHEADKKTNSEKKKDKCTFKIRWLCKSNNQKEIVYKQFPKGFLVDMLWGKRNT